MTSALRHLTFEELLESGKDHKCPGIGPDKVCVKIAAVADLPTRFGFFHVVAFWNDKDGKDHAAITHGNPSGGEDVPVRIHSECLTGESMGSLRCDCRDQLESALETIAAEERGVVLYLRQEGRGIGFLNKIRAYGLQDQGLDTVEANEALGFEDDEREYSVAAHMLSLLQVKSIRLITNNPRKIAGLEALGVRVTGRIPLLIPPNEYNRSYLETKATKSGHLITFEQDAPLLGGFDGVLEDDAARDGNPVHEGSTSGSA